MTYYRPESEQAPRTARTDSGEESRLHARGTATEPPASNTEPPASSIHARGSGQPELSQRQAAPRPDTPEVVPRQDLPQPATRSYAEFDCEVNTLTPQLLYAHYEQSRLLYAEKATRLEPFLPVILANWERALTAGTSLLRVTLHRTHDNIGDASIAMWRSTGTCWHAQNVVNSGPPEAVRAVLLATQAATMREGRIGAVQVWFRPDHPYMGEVFGTLDQWLPPGTGAVMPGDYLMVPLAVARSLAGPEDRDTPAPELDGDEACPELAALAVRARGALYARAEELWNDDLLLESVDRHYRAVGLRRRRRIWMLPGEQGRLSAAALAHEGPLGFSLSFLENRLDLLIDPALDAEQAERAVRKLLPRACAAYERFALGAIPVATDLRTGQFLRDAGAEPVASYSQAIWLAEGYTDFYCHMDALYEHRGHRSVPDPGART